MPDILTVYDLETGKNLYGNREIHSVLGVSAEEIRAMTRAQRQEMIHPDDLPAFILNLQATRNLKDGEVFGI
jgi:glutamate 5-kinase